MTEKHAQKLSIILKSGQTITVIVEVDQAAEVHPQIQAFVELLGSKRLKEKIFMFQGNRVVVVRLSEVAAVDLVGFTQESEEQLPTDKKVTKPAKKAQ